MTTAVVGLGSNLGSREQLLRAALDLLDAIDEVAVQGVSSVRETAPVGPPQPTFLNAAARLEVTCDAATLLEHLLAVERRLGRVRRERWGPRTIDLDLLWMPGPPIDAPELTVPHPRLTERDFALAPLLEVAPELTERYGPALQRLGPPAPGEPLPRAVPFRVDDGPGQVGVRCTGRDAPDAAAAAVSALGARLWEGGDGDGPLEVCPVHPSLSGDGAAPLGALAAAGLEALERGLALRLVVVEEVGSGAVTGRLLGERGARGPRFEPAEAWLEPGPAEGVTAVLRARPRPAAAASSLAE